jgi:hypothetical protein
MTHPKAMRRVCISVALTTIAACSSSRLAEIGPNTYQIVATSSMVYDGPPATIERSHRQIDAARADAVRRLNAYCTRQRRRAVIVEEAFSEQSNGSGAPENLDWRGVRRITFQCIATESHQQQ